MDSTKPNETNAESEQKVEKDTSLASVEKNCKECYKEFREIEELENLEKIILTSNNSDFVKCITAKYEYQGEQSPEIIYKKVEQLAKLERKTLELGIVRIESMLDLYDPTKSVSVIAAILVAVLAVNTTFIQSLIGLLGFSNELIPIVVTALLYLGVWIVVTRTVGNNRLNKWRLSYFKGLMQQAINVQKGDWKNS